MYLELPYRLCSITSPSSSVETTRTTLPAPAPVRHHCRRGRGERSRFGLLLLLLLNNYQSLPLDALHESLYLHGVLGVVVCSGSLGEEDKDEDEEEVEEEEEGRQLVANEWWFSLANRRRL
jgi:hypothetical protein